MVRSERRLSSRFFFQLYYMAVRTFDKIMMTGKGGVGVSPSRFPSRFLDIGAYLGTYVVSYLLVLVSQECLGF